jgi:hypothetical protein
LLFSPNSFFCFLIALEPKQNAIDTSEASAPALRSEFISWLSSVWGCESSQRIEKRKEYKGEQCERRKKIFSNLHPQTAKRRSQLFAAFTQKANLRRLLKANEHRDPSRLAKWRAMKSFGKKLTEAFGAKFAASSSQFQAHDER